MTPSAHSHALTGNLWLTFVNKAYWEPVGRSLTALPCCRWTGLCQSTLLSASFSSSGPSHHQRLLFFCCQAPRINTAGPICTYMSTPAPTSDNHRPYHHTYHTQRYSMHSVWTEPGFPAAFVKPSGRSQTHRSRGNTHSHTGSHSHTTIKNITVMIAAFFTGFFLGFYF